MNIELLVLEKIVKKRGKEPSIKSCGHTPTKYKAWKLIRFFLAIGAKGNSKVLHSSSAINILLFHSPCYKILLFCNLFWSYTLALILCPGSLDHSVVKCICSHKLNALEATKTWWLIILSEFWTLSRIIDHFVRFDARLRHSAIVSTLSLWGYLFG